jgi:hypothetical protein
VQRRWHGEADAGSLIPKGHNMRISRITGLLLAGMLTAGLCIGTGAAAQATALAGHAASAVTPVPGVLYELTPPLITPNPLCVDVPGSSTSPGTPLQIFHCHGSTPDGANQLWGFSGPPGGPWTIQNKASGRCMKPANDSGVSGTRVIQAVCDGSQDEEWTIGSGNDFDPSHVTLVNPQVFGECLAAANTSDQNQTPLVMMPCGSVGFLHQVETWVLA